MIKDDDKVYTYDQDGTLIQLPGRANEIAVGGLNDDLYALGRTKVEGGFAIYSWNDSRWNRLPGGAEKISVGSINVNG